MNDDTLPLAKTPVPEAPTFAGTERYRLIQPLGKGGMGEVFEADDLEAGRHVALKCLSNPDAGLMLRFKDEFRALRDIVHPNLVRLGELHESEGQFFFTMELLQGTDLLRHVRPEALLLAGSTSATPSGVSREAIVTTVQRTGAPVRDTSTPKFQSGVPDRLRGHPSPQSGEKLLASEALVGGFDEARLRSAFAQLAVGLSVLHRAGKIHRDLKPSNVMVEPDGRVVILDFGVVAELEQLREQDERVIVGTAHYMAPEQARGETPAPSADWYAVGVALYQALTGRLPHPLKNYQSVLAYKAHRDPVPMVLGDHESVRDLVKLTMRLLARDPAERAGERDVFEVLGLGADSAGLTAASLVDAGPADVLGRERELEQLFQALQETREQDALTLIIEAPSGMGKSSLLRAFSYHLSRMDPSTLVLHARCHERESVRFKAFDGVVDGIARHLSARTRRGQNFEASAEDIATLCRVFPVLRSVPGFERGKGAASEAGRDPIEQRARAFDALRSLLVQVCEHRPVLVGIDDLHWADADSLALLEALLRPPGAPRMLLVATQRPGFDMLRERDVGDVRTLPLSGLTEDAARTLLARELARVSLARGPARFDAGSPSELDAEALLAESAGHPMFLEELARMSARHPRGEHTRPRLDDALRERASRLPESAQRLLESIALSGAPTQHAVMMEVSELAGEPYARAVEALRSERLVRVSGLRRVDAIEPYHDRVREALQARVSTERGRALHDALARSLLAHDGSQARIATHLELGSEPARAAEYFLRAADEARTALAFERAARLRQRALACGQFAPAQRLSQLDAVATELRLSGFAKEAGDTLLELGHAPTQLEPARIDLIRQAAELYLTSGHLEHGHRAARSALESVGRSLPASRLSAIAAFLWSDARVGLARLYVPREHERRTAERAELEVDVLWSLSVGLVMVDSVESAVLANQALLHSLAHGSPLHVVRCLCLSAVLATTVGRFGRAARMRAAVDAALGGNADPDIRLLRQIAEFAHAFMCENDWPRTLSTVAEARETWSLLGQKRGWEKAQISQIECWTLHNIGDIPQMRTRVSETIREARETGNRFLEVNFRTFFIDMALADDTPEAALAEVADAIALWKPLSGEFSNQDYLVICSRTRLALYTGQCDDPKLDREWQRFDRSLMRHVQLCLQDSYALRARLAHLRARRARARGDGSEARRQIARAHSFLKRLARHPLSLGQSQATALYADLAALEGRSQDVVQGLRTALATFRNKGMTLWTACVAHELGRRIAGDEGATLLVEACTRFAELGIRNPQRLLRGTLPALAELD